MSIMQTSSDAPQATSPPTSIAMKLEAVVVPVSDVDRAKAFYEGLGWRFDGDFPGEGGYRVVQFTPPGSDASIIFGAGVTHDEPGSLDSVLLVVDDLQAAREELRSRGADVTEPFHDPAGGLGGGWRPGTEHRAEGPDPEGRSYGTYASFTDPDGNKWLLQQITDRLPGRV
jgi:catechol 2,3-dioxygenase-like lactoylglutathione lyase family enzyme